MARMRLFVKLESNVIETTMLFHRLVRISMQPTLCTRTLLENSGRLIQQNCSPDGDVYRPLGLSMAGLALFVQPWSKKQKRLRSHDKMYALSIFMQLQLGKCFVVSLSHEWWRIKRLWELSLRQRAAFPNMPTDAYGPRQAAYVSHSQWQNRGQALFILDIWTCVVSKQKRNTTYAMVVVVCGPGFCHTLCEVTLFVGTIWLTIDSAMDTVAPYQRIWTVQTDSNLGKVGLCSYLHSFLPWCCVGCPKWRNPCPEGSVGLPANPLTILQQSAHLYKFWHPGPLQKRVDGGVGQ